MKLIKNFVAAIACVLAVSAVPSGSEREGETSSSFNHESFQLLLALHRGGTNGKVLGDAGASILKKTDDSVPIKYMGVFEGVNSDRIAGYLKLTFVKTLIKRLPEYDPSQTKMSTDKVAETVNALVKTFADIEAEYCKGDDADKVKEIGAFAVVSLMIQDQVFLANVGETMGFVSSTASLKRVRSGSMAEEKERERVSEVKDGYGNQKKIIDKQEFTRIIGYCSAKMNDAGEYAGNGMVIAEPQMFTEKVENGKSVKVLLISPAVDVAKKRESAKEHLADCLDEPSSCKLGHFENKNNRNGTDLTILTAEHEFAGSREDSASADVKGASDEHQSLQDGYQSDDESDYDGSDDSSEIGSEYYDPNATEDGLPTSPRNNHDQSYGRPKGQPVNEAHGAQFMPYERGNGPSFPLSEQTLRQHTELHGNSPGSPYKKPKRGDFVDDMSLD